VAVLARFANSPTPIRRPPSTLGRVAVVAALLILATEAAAQSPTSADAIRFARAKVAEGHRADALPILEARLAAAPADLDARLLYGLVLSWEGRYDDARRELTEVVERSPGYTDARVALANVEWWSGQPARLDAVAAEGLRQEPGAPRWQIYRARALAAQGRGREARDVVATVLARDPGHAEARALRDRLDASLRPWSSYLTQSADRFSDGRDSWRETSLSIQRLTPVGSLIVRANQAARFGRSDTLGEVEMYPRFRPGTYAFVAFGASGHDGFYPETRVAADLYQGLGGGFEGSVGWRRLGFADTTNIYVGTLTKYVGNWMLTGRAFHVPGGPGLDSNSYHGTLRRYFGGDGTSYVGAGYSRGLWREEIRSTADLVARDSDTARGEFDLGLTARLRLRGSGSTSWQDRSYGRMRQDSVSVGFGVIF
jgi:YaiO family outer membrane protein